MTGTPADGGLARIARDPRAFEVFYREHVEGVLRFISRPT
jgi:hypothetical protein